MIRKLLVLYLSLIFTSGVFAKSYTSFKNIDPNDCLEYFEKARVIHKYPIFDNDQEHKQSISFVYDKELFNMIFYPGQLTYEKGYGHPLAFECYKFTN